MGNVSAMRDVSTDVTTNDIHTEIERISEERQELWQRLSEGLDTDVQGQIRDLDAQLQDLWQLLRVEKARLRFGEREEIVRRARAEERLERAA
jgi:Protein of unknown function (DUF2630)